MPKLLAGEDTNKISQLCQKKYFLEFIDEILRIID